MNSSVIPRVSIGGSRFATAPVEDLLLTLSLRLPFSLSGERKERTDYAATPLSHRECSRPALPVRMTMLPSCSVKAFSFTSSAAESTQCVAQCHRHSRSLGDDAGARSSRTLRHRSKRRPAARSDSLEIIPPLFNREPSYVPGLIMHQAYDIPATNPETAGSCENFGLRIVHCGFGMKQ